jgi:outer membrane receptor protein involved in Fe transport
MQFSKRILAVLAMLLVSIAAFAQTTANLTGRVTLDGAPLPGVTVTVSSPNLQGTRTTTTDVNGNYNFGSLPPGEYSVRFELESMQPVNKTTRIGVGQTGRADADMKMTAVAESITVTASAPAVVETTEVQANIPATLVEDLPIGRTLVATTALAPGVNQNGPNVGAITISGALAADNLFMVNGAVTNENLRGQPHNLFIEDAIQETTVSTAAISAEYGRFTGGVVNAITKSGGNEFSGSLRDSLANDDWTAKGPLQDFDNLDEIRHTYEGTLGGYVVRDRLWFFGAGRYFKADTQSTFQSSSVPFIAGNEELRYEGKLTGQITPKHNLMGSYLKVQTDQVNNCFIACFEETNLDTARSLPNDFLVARYNGVLTNNFLLEGSYTKKTFTFEGSGGDDPDRIRGTWGYDVNTGAFYGAPVFCGFCDPEERNNTTYGLKATYYLSSKALGTHSLVGGYENWTEERIANNYQSASNFGLVTGYSGAVQRGADGTILPFIAAGDLIGYFPIDVLTQGSNFVTDSLYFNDKWDLSSKWQFNIGVRYDKNDGKDTRGATVADDDAFSPRLGLVYDVRGDGRFRINASYSRYVNKVAESIGSGASPAGNPNYFYYEYGGPTISGLPTQQALQQVFTWFDRACDATGHCGTANTDLLVAATVQGLSTQIRDSLVSPSADEFTVGFGSQIGTNGFFRVDYIDRTWNDFFVRRTDLSTGQVINPVTGGRLDLTFIENSDDLERTYKAIQLQTAYRLGQRWNIGGNYTWSETKGNQTGQTGGSGPIADVALQYPEFRAFEQTNPVGFLPQDQTHKLRGWVSWDLPTPIGNFNFTALQRFDSGTPYSAVAAIDPRAYVSSVRSCTASGGAPPCYATRPSAVNYYFSDRGEFRWDDLTATDLAVNYNLPIRRVGLFVQAELLNIFDEDAQISGDTTVNLLTPFNPFADTPVEGTHWEKGEDFGEGLNPTTNNSAGHFQLPRTFRVSLGFRF